MGWFRVDDEFLTNPKVMSLSAPAKVLYLAGIAYCSTNLTDGHIPAGAIRLVAASAATSQNRVGELVRAGLWQSSEEGWDVHDYLEHQDPAERVRARRATNRERMQSWRDKRRDKPASNAVTNGVSSALHSTAQYVIPPTPLTGPTEGPPADRPHTTIEQPHPDQTVIDHIATQIGWHTAARQHQLAAEWDYGLTRLDRRYLEDTLLRCTDAHSPNYLHQAIDRAAQGTNP